MFGSNLVRASGGLAACLVALAIVLGTTAGQPDNPFFRTVWERTDKPVADGLANRTWQWGPQANTGSLREPYAESPGGEREVQYYDKSRMEITHPDSGDPSSIWFVTNGLLVVELTTGQMQVGDSAFQQRTPANVNVAGDGDDTLGPTYAALARLRTIAPLADGALVIQTVDRGGQVSSDSQYASYGVTAAHRVNVPGIDHQVASPFWAFMNSIGIVLENGVPVEAPLFENPYFATGLPITEAYWVRIKVGGTVKPVLLQCFERRCLTYTPDNPPGWQVEQGNVGQHYYQWRYQSTGPAATATATGSAGEPTTAGTSPAATATGIAGAPTATATSPAATATSIGMASPTATGIPGEPPATVYAFSHKFGQLSDPGHALLGANDAAVDSDRNIYIVDTGHHRVQKYSPAGMFITQWGVYGTGNGEFDTPFAIVVDGSNDIYVADRNNHRIQKFDRNGQFLMKWGSFGAVASEFRYPGELAIGPTGEIYVADSDNHRVQVFDSAGVWVRQFGSDGSGDGQFRYPHGLAVDSAGRVYVCDMFNDRVQVFDPAGMYLRKWGTPGVMTGQFNRPFGIVLDASETLLYVSDGSNDRIQVFDINGVFQSSLGSSGSGLGQFDWPQGLGLYTEDYLLVADRLNDRVQLIQVSSQLPFIEVSGDRRGRFDTPAAIDFEPDDYFAVIDSGLNQVQVWANPLTVLYDWGYGELMVPRDLAFDTARNLYVTDAGHHRVVKYSLSGQFLDTWGSQGSDAGQFNDPRGIALDAAGNVYVVERLNHRVQKFTAAGDFVGQWGGQGNAPGQFNEPVGIAIRGGDVFVTEWANHRVQQFDLDGNFVRQWGGFGSDPGQFSTPYGIDVDERGYVYVADAGNNRVQKFTPSGAYLAQFGSTGTADGQFRSPLGVAVRDNGDVYVTDGENSRVQIFSPPV